MNLRIFCFLSILFFSAPFTYASTPFTAITLGDGFESKHSPDVQIFNNKEAILKAEIESQKAMCERISKADSEMQSCLKPESSFHAISSLYEYPGDSCEGFEGVDLKNCRAALDDPELKKHTAIAVTTSPRNTQSLLVIKSVRTKPNGDILIQAEIQDHTLCTGIHTEGSIPAAVIFIPKVSHPSATVNLKFSTLCLEK